jgi:hypothetical protein
MAKFSARDPEDSFSSRRRRSGKKASEQSTSVAAQHKRTAIGKRKPIQRTVQRRNSQLTFVYVGNVSPPVNYRTSESSTDSPEKLRSDVQNADLAELFQWCGKIINIDIRCGFGTGGVPSDDGAIVYATVLFRKVKATARAISMNGHTLLGKKIIVSWCIKAVITIVTHELFHLSYVAGLPKLSRYAGGPGG